MTGPALTAVYPATPAQQGYLLGTLSLPGDCLYTEQAVFPLVGQADAGLIADAATRLAAAHEILRTGLAWDLGDGPWQVVLAPTDVGIDIIDASGLSEEDREAQLSQVLRQQRVPFDLARPPLWRMAIQRTGDSEVQLIWTHHHSILDGWSQLQLIRDLLAACNSPGSLVPPASSFGQYALWLSQQDRARQREFWASTMRGYALPPHLPSRVIAPGQERFGTREATMRPVDLSRLEAFAHTADLTLASLIITCWAIIAAHHRSSDEIVIGVTVSGRNSCFPGAPEVIGPLSVTVPVRVTLDDREGLTDTARAVQDSIARAAAAGECTAGEVHTWAGFPPDRPGYDSAVAVGNYPALPRTAVLGGGLAVAVPAIRPYGGRTTLPLTLVTDSFGGLRMRLVNDRGRVADADADAALECMTALLTDLPGTPAPLLQDARAHASGIRALDASPGSPPRAPTPQAARGTIEEVIAGAFSDLLNQQTVPRDADFIALGGHSLLAVELLARLRKAFDADLTLGDLLSARTPVGIAARLRDLISAGNRAPEPLPGIVPAEGGQDEPFPLTPIQRAYWAGRQPGFELGDVDSSIYCEIDVPAVDHGRLEGAWRTLIRRHAMLRAVITATGQQQCLADVPDYRIAVTDLRDSDGQLDGNLAALRDRISHSPSDPAEWPLFTVEAALLPGDLTRLFLRFDLLIGDAVSWKILHREIRRLYDDPAAELPSVGLQFRDYVRALPAARSGQSYQRDREYWLGRLTPLPAPPPLPLAVHPRSLSPVRFTRRQLSLPPEQLQRLRQVARAHGATLSALLLTAFSETVARYAGTPEFLINVTTYDRLPVHPHVGDIVGDFTSLLLLHANVSDEPFATRLRKLQRQLWADLDHRLYSGLDMLRELRARGGDHTAAAAPVVFTSTLDAGTCPADAGPRLPGTVVHGIGQTPQVMLDYQAYEADGHLIINWDTVDGLFPNGLIPGMLSEHARGLQLLIADEQATQCRRLAGPGHEPPPPPPLGGQRLLHEPFLDQARAAPDAPAVISGDRTLTYAQVRDLASEAATQIAGLTRRRSLVAIIMYKGWEQVVAAVAAVMADCAFVPIEASWPASRISSLLAKTGARVVITQSRAASRLDLPLHMGVIMADRLTGAAQPSAPRSATRTVDEMAYVIFTSGSTGTPKGAMISHRGALNTVLDINARFGIGPHDRILAVSPFSFDLSVYDVFGALAAGAAVVVPDEEERTDPSALARLARDQRVSVWNSVPVLIDLLLDSLPASTETGMPDLRTCLLSGDWIPLSLPDRIRAQAPGATVISLGGATEGSIWSILYEVGRVDPGWASIPYGRSMTGQTVRVLADNLTPCPPWTPGQIHIGGHGTALGYWDEPGLTAAAFVTDSWTGERLYRTGDRGRLLPDGNIEFLGRKDEQVKIGGYRVETAEAEAALAQVPGVTRAAVVATGPRTGQRLAAFATGTASSAAVRASLAGRLPAHMIPATITNVVSLPVTPTGKVDRARLRREAEAAPEQRRELADHGSHASAVTAELAALVASIVPGEPQPATDLLEYGLTSVDVIRLCSAVERRFGQRPDLQFFYSAPTIAHLATSLAPPQTAAEALRQPAGGAPQGPREKTAVINDPQEREAFRARFPGYPSPPASRLLPATLPQQMQYRARRRTLRDFSLAPIPAQQLGGMFDSLRMVAIDGRAAFLYPSAGGLYSVAAYLHIRPGRVDGIAGGMYYYHPAAHDLVALAGDFDLAPEIHLGPVNRPAARAAAFTIFLCTDPRDSVPLYGRDAEQLAFLNAGYMGQLLCDSAVHGGLALCPVHGIDFGALRWLFPGGDRLVLLHAMLGGLTPDAQAAHPEEGKPS